MRCAWPRGRCSWRWRAPTGKWRPRSARACSRPSRAGSLSRGRRRKHLVREAEDRSKQAVSLYELTQELDRALTAEAKTRIVELLWRVAFADARKDAHEEHRIRQIAGLLHVRHAEFIAAKIRAQARGNDREGR